MPIDRRDESIAELVKDLLRDVSELVHQEIELARVEMTEKGKKAGLGLGLFGGSAAFALVTLGGSMATIVVLLRQAMPLSAGRADHDRGLRRGGGRCWGFAGAAS